MAIEASLLPVDGLVPDIWLALTETLPVVPVELPVPAPLFEDATDPDVLLALFET